MKLEVTYFSSQPIFTTRLSSQPEIMRSWKFPTQITALDSQGDKMIVRMENGDFVIKNKDLERPLWLSIKLFFFSMWYRTKQGLVKVGS